LPADAKFRPFCSERCRLLDLKSRNGSYVNAGGNVGF